MKSIKMILEGIGILLFAISCILAITLWDWKFLEIPCIAALFIGVIMIVVGPFLIDNE